MLRSNFSKIISLRSFWRIDKRKGNYTLPSGEKLSQYVRELVVSQMSIDSLGISIDGNLYPCYGCERDATNNTLTPYTILVPFGENEQCSYIDMEKRIDILTREIIG